MCDGTPQIPPHAPTRIRMATVAFPQAFRPPSPAQASNSSSRNMQVQSAAGWGRPMVGSGREGRAER